ncbi:tetratricopeptide repeat protein [uncultured Draconibacterium sp.]|uniref:tetratricopeptide repeat protein n=1 Tax=uncultured Draconibacterium sp. TaxID=1573823 RepID=UPI0029C883E6|nr:tetratricopeptide repeat protein [uncultured Draconibacterium sp.]
MKLKLTLILIFCITISFAQKGVIDEANKLIELKKYESAFKLLDDADPNDEKPEIAIAKTKLVLNYYVSSEMHEIFALKDLTPNEKLSAIRGSEGNFTNYKFSPNTVLSDLIEKYPDNYELQKELGNFYHEIHLKYDDNWLLPDSVLVEKFQSYYLNAYDHDVFDAWSAYGIGYAYLINLDYQSSIPYFKKSIELNNKDPYSNYNLAYAYLYTDQTEKGIESAKKALDLYDDPGNKANVARMIAVMYLELEDSVNAMEYYKRSDAIQPDNYSTVEALLELEMALNMESYKERTKQFFLLAPEAPAVYQDLMRFYWTANKPDELIQFLAEQTNNYSADYRVSGNLKFYTALIQHDKKDFKNAKLNFQLAKEAYEKVFASDHQVFKVIESYNNKLANYGS